MNTFVRKISQLKNSMTMNDFEILMHKATSNEPSFLPDSQISALVEKTYFQAERKTLMNHLWTKLHGPKDKWRKILKALQVVKEITETGSPEANEELRNKIAMIKVLENYEYFEQNVDRGAAIRDMAKELVQKLKRERKGSNEGGNTSESLMLKQDKGKSRKLELSAPPRTPPKKPGTVEDLGLGKDFLDYNPDSDEGEIGGSGFETLKKKDGNGNVDPRRNYVKKEEPKKKSVEASKSKPLAQMDDDFLSFD